MWREDWRIETTKVAADGVTELVLRGPDDTSLDLRGGQFLWLTVSPNRPPFHDHPFSVASSSGFLPRLRLLVARAGNCTDTFQELAPGTRVALDGPHGSFVLPSRTSAIVMLAGGVGIAPILGMLEEAAERGDRRPFRLLYAARSEAALARRSSLSELGRRLDFKVTYCVDETCPAPGILRGPICSEHLRQLASGLALGDTSVMLCGPTGMMEAAADTFLSLGSPVSNIHYERFDFGAGKGRIDRQRRAAALSILAVVAASALAFSLR
jgi:ferredoxin-NADP reductase